VLDLFVGGLFYMRSEGMVLGEPATVAAEFPVTVQRLQVREGERVRAGDVTAVVSSQSVAESIARLTAELASRRVRLSEIRMRAETIEAMLGIAEYRNKVATDARRQLETLLDRGWLSIDKRTSATESEFRSLQDLEGLKAEKRVIDAEFGAVQAAVTEAEGALAELRRLYDEGRLRAPISGIVSRIVADKGAVVRTGEPVMEIYGDNRYVLAYVPTGGLYEVAPGNRVEIKSGLQHSNGVIIRVEPYAAALPREFQRSFAPVERQQVIRVEFAPGEIPPPLFTKVHLTSPGVVSYWTAAARAHLKDTRLVILLRRVDLALGRLSAPPPPDDSVMSVSFPFP
jgi:membrane fusion protein (multidrug efflux system)